MSDSDLHEVPIAPGLFTEGSERVSTSRWIDGNRVRFFNGLPEKMGGWLADIDLSSVPGVIRNMLSWARLNRESLVAFGSSKGMWLLKGEILSNISPIRIATPFFGGSEDELVDPFEFTDGSTVVIVTHDSHGLLQGDYVQYDSTSNDSSIPTEELEAYQPVTEVIDGDNYTITMTTEASGGGVPDGGAAVDFSYEENAGSDDTVSGTGWGVGGFGLGRNGWGTAYTVDVTPGGDQVVIPARTWSLVPWGEDLVFAPRGGHAYLYDSSVNDKAEKITEVPSPLEALVLSSANQQIFAMGCVPPGGSVQDPMYLRWCDSRDYTEWTAAADNSAGGYRLDQGNFIIVGLQVGTVILVLTDVGGYRIFPVATSAVYGKQYLGKTSLVGPNAATEYKGVAYWMGVNNFYRFDNRLDVLPCEVHQKVFLDLNREQLDKVVCGANHSFNEILWFYPSRSSTEIDRYVTYNTTERFWSFGALNRTAWRDSEFRFDSPFAIGGTTLYQHEVGHTADGQAMGEFLRTYAFDIRLGGVSNTRQVIKLDTWVPDFKILDSAVDLTISMRKWPQGVMASAEPLEIRGDTELIKKRVRGRQISLLIEGKGPGHWRMATFRIGGRADGNR